MTRLDISTTSREVRDLRARVRDELQTEYARLSSVDRPALLDLLSETAGATTEVVQQELALLDERIAAVHDYLGDLHEPSTGRPGLGSCVEVDLGAGPRWMLLASLEVSDDDDVVAVDSPLGRSLLAASPGESFAFTTSEGTQTGRLIAVDVTGSNGESGQEGVARQGGSAEPRTLAKLDKAEALRLLGEARVGALAFCMLGSAHVEVVNFVLDGDEPVFRIGSSAKLAAVGRGHPFALHVDRVDEHQRTGWSVTVTGRVRLVRGEEADRLTALVVPWAGGLRPYVVKMTVHQVEGRRLGAP